MKSVRAVLFVTTFAYSPVALAAWETRELAGMSVEVYTPATTSPIGSGHALMIGLHGCAQTGTQLRDYGNLEATAEGFGMIVALPTVANGGVIAGCWNYYGAMHSRDAGDPANVIGLAEGLRDDPANAIDPAQVYLVGFSAGGGEALIAGCLAPEVFAGVAISAGPSLGTEVSQISAVGTTVEAAAALCVQFSTNHAVDFSTQLAIAFTDTQDFTVAQGYAPLNADMFASIYGAEQALVTSPIDVATLPGSEPTGTGLAYADEIGERIALVTSTGVGHNWPSGSGSTAPALAYVAGTGLNLSYFAADMFTTNNRRTGGGETPDDTGDVTGSDDDGGSEDAGDDESDAEGGTSDSGDVDDEGDDDDGGSNASVGMTAAEDGRIDPTGCQCNASDPRIGVVALLLLVLPGLRRRREPSPRAVVPSSHDVARG